MKIGVSSYSFQQLIGPGEQTQKSVIALAAQMGFEGIEFTDLNVPENMTEKEYAAEIREECEKYSLPVAAYTIGADLLKGEAEIERVCRKLDVASVLGAPALRHDTAWGLSGEDKSFKGFENVLPVLADSCRKITQYAESIGIVTMTENHGQFCQESARVEKLINTVAHPNFGVLCDIGNFNCADENSAQAVGRLLPYIKHVHAKDFHIKSGNGFNPCEGFFRSRAGNYLRGAIIGHGDVPVYQCVKTIAASGYDGFISIEFEGMENCLNAIRIGLENLKGMIK
jgi:sugar phosphate isomerase/epimerase